MAVRRCDPDRDIRSYNSSLPVPVPDMPEKPRAHEKRGRRGIGILALIPAWSTERRTGSRGLLHVDSDPGAQMASDG